MSHNKQMRVNFSPGIWTVKHINLIVAILIAYFLSLFILDSPVPTVLGIIAIVFLFIFASYAKSYIYFMVFTYPIMGILQTYIPVQVGGLYSGFNLGGIFVLMGVVYGIFYFVLKKPRIIGNELTVSICIFMVIILISIAYVPGNHLYAFRQWVRLLSHIPLYFIILEEFKDHEDANKLLNLLYYLFVPMFVYFLLTVFIPSLRGGIMRTVTSDLSTELTVYRLAGFLQANSLGTLLVIFSVLTIYYFFEARKKNKWIYVLIYIMTIFLLLNTLSRNSWITFVFVMLVIGILRFRLFVLLLLLLSVFLVFAIPDIWEIIWLRMQPDTSATNRITLAKYGWDLFEQKPIWGWGLGYFQMWSRANLGGGAGYQYGVGGIDLHNEYMRVMVETGLIGLLSYLYLMYRGLKISFKLFRLPLTTAKNYGIFVLALIVAIMMNGITGQGFRDSAFYFWVFLAIGEINLRNMRSSVSTSVELAS